MITPPQQDSPQKPYSSVRLLVLTQLGTQVIVVAGSMTAPILAIAIAQRYQVPAEWIALYASFLYAASTLTSLCVGRLIEKLGAIGVSQLALVMTLLAQLCFWIDWVGLLVLNAWLTGFAYSMPNPTSSHLLSQATTAANRGLIFSIKQTSVPIGILCAAYTFPSLADLAGWRGVGLVVIAVSLLVLAVLQRYKNRMQPSYQERRLTSAKNWVWHSALSDVWRQQALRAVGVMSASFGAMQYTVSSVFVVLMVTHTQATLAQTTSWLSIAMVMAIFLRIASGALADRVGHQRCLQGLCVLSGFSSMALCLLGPVMTPAAALLLGMVLACASHTWNGVYLAAVAEAAGPARVASATSGTMVMTFLGGLCGTLFFLPLSAWFGYSFSFGLLTAAMIASLYYWQRTTKTNLRQTAQKEPTQANDNQRVG